MLIDNFLPEYDVNEYHEIVISAPPERVYAAVRSVDLSKSGIINLLFRLRGMPPSMLSIDGLLAQGFILLDECPPEELLLGLIGQFWTPFGRLQKIAPSAFTPFNEAEYAKAVWNFHLIPANDGQTRLTTETRVQCLDPVCRRRFTRYWALIGPFSAWIRRLMLAIIKRETEANLQQT